MQKDNKMDTTEEKNDTSRMNTGFLIAAAAATLLLGGCATTDEAETGPSIIKCMGANSCKGQSQCKTMRSACKALNNCRSTGWIATTEHDCKLKGGKYDPSDNNKY